MRLEQESGNYLFLPKREDVPRRSKNQNKQRDAAEAYPDVRNIKEKRPVDPIFAMNMDEVDHVTDCDSVDQIAECAGEDDKKWEMIEKRQIPDMPGNINDKKN